MEEFKDKVVVVTGASSGIGRAIAEQFGAQGAKVVLFGRNQKRLSEVASKITQALIVQGDVRKTSDLNRLYQECQQKWGNIDVLIANAGVADARKITEVDENFFDEIVDINYKGLYFTVQRALPFLNSGASIVLISSVAASIGWPEYSVYASTKAAVSHLARCFSAELITQGIRVNALSPGFVDTPIFDPSKESDPEVVKKLSALVPAGRFTTAEEIAHATLFLCSPKSSYIVATDLIIDGGLSGVYLASL